MTQLKAYHRPDSVEEALQLLTQSGINTSVIGGGTYIVPRLNKTVDEVVDLQGLGLTEVTLKDSELTLGAMTRLQAIVENEHLPSLLRECAQREGPNTLRESATIGGLIVRASAESELLAALLVFDTKVRVQTSSQSNIYSLVDFLSDIPSALADGLVTSISMTISGATASARVARTPADRPIVAAIARLGDDGQVRLALCGVSSTAILVDPSQVETAISPTSDFRGSSRYRRQMAATLARRAVSECRAPS